ncbi:hypothetical protein [Microcoleus vaginatus]|uniref:hypothetical protein n=1 Tax=Microcoleus vaginatus TaxID=119532 RepID=UPI0032A8A77F
MSKTPESSGFCQKMSAIDDYGFVKNLEPVCKVCVWVSEAGFFLGGWAQGLLLFFTNNLSVSTL